MSKNLYYGKINNLGNFIIPKKEKFVKFENTFMFEPIKDLFLELRKELKVLELRGIIKDFKDLKLNNIYEHFEDRYTLYISQISEKIIERILSSNIEIKNVYDFVNFIEMDLTRFLSYFPISRIGYFVSNLNSILYSGLTYEFMKEDYNNENLKTLKYYQSEEFKILRKIFDKYGFKISEEIPWRFFVDLNSKKLINKIKEIDNFLNLTLDNIFNIWYNSFNSFNEFKNILTLLNNTYHNLTLINKNLNNKLINLNFNRDLNVFLNLFFNIINKEFKININILNNLKARARVYIQSKKNFTFPLDKCVLNDYLLQVIQNSQTFQTLNS